MTWDAHLRPYKPDPREARCVPWVSKMPHVYRIAELDPSGKQRCIHCRRAKGRRYPKPKSS